MSLTLREKQVVDFVAQGLKNWQIGERMGISHNTVKAHLRNIGLKVGVSRNNRIMIVNQVRKESGCLNQTEQQ